MKLFNMSVFANIGTRVAAIILLAILACMIKPTSVIAQKVYFCSDVDDSNGSPLSTYDSIPFDTTGTFASILVIEDSAVNTQSVTFDIFTLDSLGNETLLYEKKQSVDRPDFNFFWMAYQFPYQGEYKVYAYDAQSSLITTGQIKVLTSP